MRRCLTALGGALLFLAAGCTPTDDTAAARPRPAPATFLETANITVGPDGRCFADRILAPAVTERVTEQVLVIPAQTDADGMVTEPAIYRNQEVDRIVSPEQRENFETLCPPDFTPAFISSLQRALAARNAYSGPISGIYDTHTGEAVRLFQNQTGPNSQIIARETAQTLGLVALSADQIDTASPRP